MARTFKIGDRIRVVTRQETYSTPGRTRNSLRIGEEYIVTNTADYSDGTRVGYPAQRTRNGSVCIRPVASGGAKAGFRYEAEHFELVSNFKFSVGQLVIVSNVREAYDNRGRIRGSIRVGDVFEIVARQQKMDTGRTTAEGAYRVRMPGGERNRKRNVSFFYEAEHFAPYAAPARVQGGAQADVRVTVVATNGRHAQVMGPQGDPMTVAEAELKNVKNPDPARIVTGSRVTLKANGLVYSVDWTDGRDLLLRSARTGRTFVSRVADVQA